MRYSFSQLLPLGCLPRDYDPLLKVCPICQGDGELYQRNRITGTIELRACRECEGFGFQFDGPEDRWAVR